MRYIPVMQPKDRIKRRIEQPRHCSIAANSIMDSPVNTLHAIPWYKLGAHVEVIMLHSEEVVDTGLHTLPVIFKVHRSFTVVALCVGIGCGRIAHRSREDFPSLLAFSFLSEFSSRNYI